jgi:hypothetical protein
MNMLGAPKYTVNTYTPSRVHKRRRFRRHMPSSDPVRAGAPDEDTWEAAKFVICYLNQLLFLSFVSLYRQITCWSFMEEERDRHANSLNDSACNAHTRRPSSSSIHAMALPWLREKLPWSSEKLSADEGYINSLEWQYQTSHTCRITSAFFNHQAGIISNHRDIRTIKSFNLDQSH